MDVEVVGHLTVHLGLRVGEACAATDADLVRHGDRRALAVRRKGGRRELVGLLEPVADLAEKLAAAQGPGPLLRGREGGALHRQVAWRWVRRLARSAGITGDVLPHLLRHSYVSQALLAEVPVPVVAAGAGHRVLRTTLGYAQALAALAALGASSRPGACGLGWHRRSEGRAGRPGTRGAAVGRRGLQAKQRGPHRVAFARIGVPLGRILPLTWENAGRVMGQSCPRHVGGRAAAREEMAQKAP